MRSDTRGLADIRLDLSSKLRGLYGRVARQLRVDPSYVSRVARGERESKIVEAALKRELAKITARARRKRTRERSVA